MSIFIELIATDAVLKKWKNNPRLTKKELGVWSHWKQDKPENHLPLSEQEISQRKKILKKHAPSAYRTLFP